MTEELKNPYAADDENTDETSLAGKFFLWTWYKRTTKGFGDSRSFFMPFGFLAMGLLAFYIGFPALQDLSSLLMVLFHKTIGEIGGLIARLVGSSMDTILILPARRQASQIIATFWAAGAVVYIVVNSVPPKEKGDELGYIVPGSSILARAWGMIGKRLYQLKKTTGFLLSYLRDLNIQKVHLPVSLLLLVVLALASMAQALENILLEIPARLPGLRAEAAWIPLVSWLTATTVCLVLGIPLVAHSLLHAHEKSVKIRTQKKLGLLRRRLKGLLSLVLVFVPLAWMSLKLFAGYLT